MEQAQNPYQGRELLSWVVDEFERYERGPIWYAAMILLGMGLLLYAVVTQNFLFAVIILMFAVIIGLSSLREPQKLLFAVTSHGIGIGTRFFHFKEFGSFWILYEPPHVKNIYLEFKQSIRPHLVIPLYEENPLTVREALLQYLREDAEQEDEPLSDTLGRVLKL